MTRQRHPGWAAGTTAWFLRVGGQGSVRVIPDGWAISRFGKIENMNTKRMPRRSRFIVPLAAATVAAVLAAAPASAAPRAVPSETVSRSVPSATPTPASGTAPLALTLPAPTGKDQVGTVALHLVDPTRTDPLVPGHQPRQLMISIWYPAAHTHGYPTAPYTPAAAATHLEAGLGTSPDAVTLPATVGHVDAPVDRRGGPHPVVLYSPGSGEDREFGTAQVEQLASDGYIVVTIDPTHDAGEVEFPDGTLALSTLPTQISDAFRTELIDLRAADASFVINELTDIHHGGNPSVEHTPLPTGLKGALDLSRIGMFGHSDGGATAATAMRDDPRIKAGLDMDGTLYGPVATSGLHRPFLLLSAQDLGDDPTWETFLAHSTGWKRWLRLTDSEHLSFTDAEAIYPQAAPLLGFSSADLAQLVGTLDPTRSITVQRTYIEAFFGQYLEHQPSLLLNAPSPAYPEIQFVH
ncbi:MAG: hydrolase [Streptosporangiaceae bacterium]|jgi:predicted dienelactone hydrolase|nr:hydrolase [Streptosporangiaceae bacterium]